MNKGKKLYEGKAKIIYEGPEKGTAIQHFKDEATAFNNQKKSTVEGKGVLNNRISEYILSNLNQIGIKTHLIKRLNMREQLVRLVEIIPLEFIIRNIATGSLTKRLGIADGTVLSKPLFEYCYKNDDLGDPLVAKEHILEFNWASFKELDLIKDCCLRINDFMQGMFRSVGIKLVEIIPIEFVVRNIATGSLTKRLGIEDGTVLDKPLIEFCYKNDDLNDPLVAKEHITAFGWAEEIELDWIKNQCLRINDFMQGMFKGVEIKLVDFKLEFGRLNQDGKKRIVLADEISPDTCRLWDASSEEKLDKDRFRKDLGNLLEAYQEVARRLNILHEETNIKAVEFGKLRSIKNRK